MVTEDRKKFNKFATNFVSKSLKRFGSAVPRLGPLLDAIRDAAAAGKPIPARAKAEPGTTDLGVRAYGDSYAKAKAIAKEVASSLTTEQLEHLSGIGFTDASDESKKRDDVTNAIMSAWDSAASQYMKNARSAGDKARDDLVVRLEELDDAVNSDGKSPAKPTT